MSEISVDWSKLAVRLEGKSAVIFGASVGIGAATARVLAESGAMVVLASRNLEAIESVAREIRENGGVAEAVRTDVQHFDEVKKAVHVAVKQFGGLDILVNNAGIQGQAQPVDEQSEDDFDRIINVNLKGVWIGMKAGVPELRKRGAGAIVNVASVGGLIAAPGISPYCASKHGVIGLSKSAALDCAPLGIRVNVVAPGAIDTSMFNDWMTDDEQRNHMIGLHPLGRVGQPHEVAAAIAWLASDAASFVTGAVLAVDGGYIVP